ncbi:MAG: quinolinate synthase NadA, partial [Prevotellaceae bacterium]|nr:quinolinate synthase NadA [Prevotellaceae bacterium]
PDTNAGCSLADSCNAEELKKFKKEHPGYKVVSYVNTTADVKALSYMCVTSGNAKKIIDSFPQDEKLIFCPDFNLGSYINKVSNRNMLLWNGGCHVHSRFSPSALVELKEKNPGVKVLAHPECKKEILDLADVIGSTAAILKYANESSDTTFIVATEIGIFYELKRQSPDKTFIPVPAENVGCNECGYMKMNTLENILEALKTEQPEVIVDESLSEKALKPITRMLELS